MIVEIKHSFEENIIRNSMRRTKTNLSIDIIRIIDIGN